MVGHVTCSPNSKPLLSGLHVTISATLLITFSSPSSAFEISLASTHSSTYTPSYFSPRRRLLGGGGDQYRIEDYLRVRSDEDEGCR
jgi:hypothetical protein